MDWRKPKEKESFVPKGRHPYPTVDIIVELNDRIVLIQRKNPPFGWALPGGFVDYGETVESAAYREAREEIGLDVEIIDLVGVYSDPHRDDRFHTISIVFLARATGTPHASDDAAGVALFDLNALPETMAFDHRKILDDYLARKKGNPDSAGS